MARVMLFVMLCLASLASVANPRLQDLLDEAERARSADPKRFQELLGQLVPLEKEASAHDLGRIAYLRAYSDVYAGHCDEGSRKAERLIASSSNPDIKARSSALIVNCFAISRQFLQGLRELERLSSLTMSATLADTRQHSLFASANLYAQVGQYRLGLRDVTHLLERSGRLSARSRCFSEQLRLDLLEKLGKLPADEAPIKQVIALCTAVREPLVVSFARIVLARHMASGGRRDEAEAVLQNNLDEIESTNYPRLVTEAKALLSEFLLVDEKLDAAEMLAREAISEGKVDRGILPLVAANRVLYEIARRRGNAVAALEHYRAFAEADKEYLNEIKARELAYQIVRQEGQQKNQQIELLNRKNSLLQLQQSVDQQRTQNSRLLMLLFALLAASMAYWGFKTKRLQMSVKRMAETDALTGICNRHHFTIKSEESIAQCQSAGEHAALIMFDLDHFKSINDNYGHSTGDWVLKRVAATCSKACREVDHFGRIGGEEFAILLHGYDLKGATRIAEDCRTRLAQIVTSESGHAFPVSASFGVSATSMSGHDLDKMLSHADQMLYRAKREGRNRVRTYAPDLPMEMSEQAPDNLHGTRRWSPSDSSDPLDAGNEAVRA